MADNQYEADLSLGVVTPDSTGTWAAAGIHYTQQPEIRFSIRGYEPVERKFGVFIKDRWGNTSDTLYSDNLPLFEEEIDRSDFKEVQRSEARSVGTECDSPCRSRWSPYH